MSFKVSVDHCIRDDADGFPDLISSKDIFPSLVGRHTGS